MMTGMIWGTKDMWLVKTVREGLSPKGPRRKTETGSTAGEDLHYCCSQTHLLSFPNKQLNMFSKTPNDGFRDEFTTFSESVGNMMKAFRWSWRHYVGHYVISTLGKLLCCRRETQWWRFIQISASATHQVSWWASRTNQRSASEWGCTTALSMRCHMMTCIC